MQNQPVSSLPSASDIMQACRRIRVLVKTTPVLTSELLNSISGAKLFFKCENFQKAGAFKYRGATNAIMQLLASNPDISGVCTHSSGNHAQALSLAAKLHNLKAYIVMPENAPQVKVKAVENYGGIIKFCKPTLEARELTLNIIQEESGASFVHPYNDYRIIEGQATCYYEMLHQIEDQPDYVIAPLGGGGLLSGTLLTARYFSGHTKVIGAEPLMANDGQRSFNAGTFFPSENPQTIADGLKTSMGSLTWPIIKDYTEDIISATEENIAKAMILIWERMKILVEPSSAVPLAALLENKDRFKNKTVVIIISGGNVDIRNFGSIIDQFSN